MEKVKKSRLRVADIQIPSPTLSNGDYHTPCFRDGGIHVSHRLNPRKEGIGHKILRHLSPRPLLSRFSNFTINNERAAAAAAKESNVASASASHSKEVDFNVGVGLGFFFVTAAATRNEINKMMRVRKEMEIMLESVKELVKNKDLSSHKNHVPSTPPACRQVKDMDRLEAELESELQRLEYHLNMEDSLQQQNIVEVNMDDTGPRESMSTMYGEHEEEEVAAGVEERRPRQQDGGGRGVVAEELERRLREVMEVQQEERIKELECELEDAKRKALENENEACRWKEKAQHVMYCRSSPSPFHAKAKKS